MSLFNHIADPRDPACRQTTRGSYRRSTVLILAANLVLAVASPTAVASWAEEATLTVGEFRKAKLGQAFTVGGQIRQGDEASGYAEGYVVALLEAGAASGQLCGMHTIKPHEMQAMVYEQLADVKPTLRANAAVMAILRKIYPCKKR
jgi:hypothetical protein